MLSWVAQVSFAQDIPASEQYYVADVELHTADEFLQLLLRAEQFLIQGQLVPEGGAKVTLVLHGPVLTSLIRDSYLQHKDLVDMAARLSALEVIDVKACSSWLSYNKISPGSLQPFVETVTYGPAEVERLVTDRNYLYF